MIVWSCTIIFYCSTVVLLAKEGVKRIVIVILLISQQLRYGEKKVWHCVLSTNCANDVKSIRNFISQLQNEQYGVFFSSSYVFCENRSSLNSY